jgi:FkbM family methyltransferase
MRYKIENMFIAHECQRLGVDRAPIGTYLYETYAQCNEDILIESCLQAIMFRSKRLMTSVVYCEIGANHPIQTSGTYLLSRLHGATGVLVEANPHLIATLREKRPNDKIVNCAITATHRGLVDLFIHAKNELSSLDINHIDRFRNFGGKDGIVESISIEAIDINSFMENLPEAEKIDFLSIDVEGEDFEILKALQPRFCPSLIQCEHNGEIEKFNAMLEGKGYRMLAVTDVNLVFMKSEVFR